MLLTPRHLPNNSRLGFSIKTACKNAASGLKYRKLDPQRGLRQIPGSSGSRVR
jgi:hypothetical protein